MIEVNVYTAKAEPVKSVSRRQVFVVRLRPGELPAFLALLKQLCPHGRIKELLEAR